LELFGAATRAKWSADLIFEAAVLLLVLLVGSKLSTTDCTLPPAGHVNAGPFLITMVYPIARNLHVIGYFLFNARRFVVTPKISDYE
jgi:hypothetical protein